MDVHHPCPTCNRTFKRKNSLNRHLLYSCGQNPRFKCPYCWYRCKLRSNVYRHVRTAHKKREVFAMDVVRHCVNKPN
ncbi:longitudinals lacking protein, isoforms A/B/D/L-like [Andrena cerasifolii]|uniref:longitudinals lacking protein, isoforms A/B/D/L-like n=1 Tax=Andrena cerasifolii TaxID=2819439 RepID=UPI0040376A44